MAMIVGASDMGGSWLAATLDRYRVGAIEELEPRMLQDGVRPPVAWYREFAPCEALRGDVYALFSFVPGTVLPSSSRPPLREVAFRHAVMCAPQLADGQVSIRFELGQTSDAVGNWRADSNALGGTVIGPMSGVGRTAALELAETVGAYFRPGRAAHFFGVSISELTDTAVALGDIWGGRSARLSSGLADLSEAARLDRVESILLAGRRHDNYAGPSLDIEGVAASVLRRAGRITVEELARSSGVSRQHLSRAFRARLGVGPKLYGRLARFQSILAYTGAGASIDWAVAALDMGFADQSHMIAECRRFGGLTPQSIANRDWFHPFIERAKFPARSAGLATQSTSW
jgi:AraC-like DNA-binding protein